MKKYGWKPDLPDNRDLVYKAPKLGLFKKAPNIVDLRPKMPPVYDQGQLGSCTANAIGAAFEYELIRQNENFMPSRLFIYYNERVIEGTVNSDSGAQIRDGIKTVVKQGVCSEKLWPYDIAKFSKKPLTECYANAAKFEVVQYLSVKQDVNQIIGCLNEGFPVIIGFTVYESFESDEVANSGVLNMPAPGEQVLGGHAVLVVGYNSSQKRFIVRNSWGTTWGQAGHFTMPYAYLTDPNLSSDFWTIRTIKQNKV